jgi:hypothetical protein
VLIWRYGSCVQSESFVIPATAAEDLDQAIMQYYLK